MGLRDPRLLRRILSEGAADGGSRTEARASSPQVVVVVRHRGDEREPRPAELASPEVASSELAASAPLGPDFSHQVGRLLDEAWGGEESEERLSIGTLPPAPEPQASELQLPVRPPTRLLQGSWQHDLEGALDALDVAEVDPAERKRLSKDPGLVELKAILERGPLSPDDDQRATRRIKRGDVRGAIDALSDLVEQHKTHPQPWTKRGIARARAGDLAGAVADYSRALELDPQYLPAWANRGSANFHLKDLEGTVRDCSRALELAPRLAQAWLFRGIAQAKLGRAEAAGDLYEFLELSPYSPWVKLIRETLKQIDNWDEDDPDEEE